MFGLGENSAVYKSRSSSSSGDSSSGMEESCMKEGSQIPNSPKICQINAATSNIDAMQVMAVVPE